MTEVMSRIELGGELGRLFGKTHHRLIRSVKEAGVALSATLDGFHQYMITSKQRGLTYAVFKGKKNIGEDDLDFPITMDVIRIVPVIIGSKKAGLLQTILGAVLVVVGAVTQQYYLVATGVSLAAGGVIQMLSPQAAGLAREGANKFLI